LGETAQTKPENLHKKWERNNIKPIINETTWGVYPMVKLGMPRRIPSLRYKYDLLRPMMCRRTPARDARFLQAALPGRNSQFH
jgi:hypothetical protein